MLHRENSRLVKRSYDLLMWMQAPDKHLLQSIIKIGILLNYVQENHTGSFTVRFFVPEASTALQEMFTCAGLTFETVASQSADEAFRTKHADIVSHGSEEPFATAIGIGADCLVVAGSDSVLSFAPAADHDLKLAVTDSTFLLTLVRIFASGFDVPWSFVNPIANLPWSSFYQITERESFMPLHSLEELLQRLQASPDVRESCRSLIHNRITQISFARDRLNWLSMQRDAARRDGFNAQNFQLETSFYLNSYYLLISGAYDHLAVLVNAICELNLKPKQVGATYSSFLERLQARNSDMHVIFAEKNTTEFLSTLNALRHLAAHRGSITPTTIYLQPEREPTEAEMREHIVRSGRAWMLDDGPEWISETRRFLTKIEMMEVFLEDAVIIEVDGRQSFIRPLAQTSDNFAQMRHFINRVAALLCRQLQPQESSS